MSLLSKVRMSPCEGTRNGQTTRNERQRNQQIGSDAKAVEETDEPKRGRADPEGEHPANQTITQGVSCRRSARPGLETTRAQEQQLYIGRNQTTSAGSVEEQISGFWTNPGTREVGGERETHTLEGKCAETDDQRAGVESPQSEEGGSASTTRAARLLWRVGAN